jgi:putative ABC transport system substrate-binding protein
VLRLTGSYCARRLPERGRRFLTTRNPHAFQYGDEIVTCHSITRASGIAPPAWCVGRILAAEKPAHLAVEQSTKLDLFINLKTVNALRMTTPPSLLARADETIE